MSLSEKPKQRLAALEGEIPALQMAVGTANYAHDVEGGNINDVLAAEANLADRLKQIERLRTWTIPEAERREAEEALAARTKAEREQAEAEEAARVTTTNGSVKITGTMARGLASVADPASLMAKAVADIIKSAESWLLKIPENVPWCDEHVNLHHFILKFVADEIATAFDRYDIALPRGEVVEQSIGQQGKELKRKLDDFARRTILERERYRPPEPERPHQIVRMLPYRPARRVAIRGEKGVAPPAFVFDPIIGDLRATTGEEKRDAIEHGAILGYEDLAAVGDPDHPEGGYVKVYLDEGAPAPAIAANPVQSGAPEPAARPRLSDAELVEELARERSAFHEWHRSTPEPLVPDELTPAIPATPPDDPPASVAEGVAPDAGIASADARSSVRRVPDEHDTDKEVD